MTLEEYQKASRETANYPDAGKNFIYPTLGLAGEAGEVANKVKKVFRDADGKINAETRQQLLDELGDVLWYVAQLSRELGFGLEDVAQANLEKLKSRYARNKIGGSGDNR